MFPWIANDQQEREIAHVLVGLFSLFGTLLGRLDLGAELANFLRSDKKGVDQLGIRPIET